MSRSKWKAPVVYASSTKAKMICPADVSLLLSVSNGKTLVTFTVLQPMVGHRVGEFYLFKNWSLKKQTNARGKR